MIVDLLLYEKIQRNRSSPYSTLFYPGIRNFNINDIFTNNTVIKKTKEPDKKDDIITQNTEETGTVENTITKDNNRIKDTTEKSNDKFNFE